jgi:hypothetical protein
MEGISFFVEYSTSPDNDSPVFFTTYPSLKIFCAKRPCTIKVIKKTKTGNLKYLMADYQTYPTKLQINLKKIPDSIKK